MLSYQTAIIIVIIISIIAYLFSCTSHKSKPTSKSQHIIAELEYQESDGTFDQHAKNALVANTQIKNRTAVDDYRAGNILELNVLQGDEIDPNTPIANIDATRTSISHYRNAVNRLMDRELAATVEITENNTRRIVEPQPVVMLDHIIDFGERNLRNIWDFGFQRILEDDIGLANILGVHNQLVELNATALTARKNKSEINIAKAKATSHSKKDFAEKLTNLNLTHTSDPQNVHDPSVRADNNHTLDIIKSTVLPGSASDTIHEISQYLTRSNISESQRQSAQKVLSEISKGNIITAYNDNEDNILKYVWDRSKLKANEENSKNIQDAVITALYQSSGVCINGRVSNIVGALATLDINEEVGAAQTEEHYKNEIFMAAKDILNEEIEIAKKAGGDMKIVAESYDDINITPDPDHQKVFENKVMERIDEVIANHKDKITPTKLNEIRIDSYVVAGLSNN